MTKAKIKIIENQQSFQAKNAEDLASRKQNLENWQGENWLYIADWSDNYGWEDWYFEYNLTSSPLTPEGGIFYYTPFGG